MSFFPLHSGFDWGYGHGYGYGHDHGNNGIVNNLVVRVNEEPRYYRRRSPRYWGSSKSSRSSSGSSRSSSSSRSKKSGRG
jgi:hypothetical protein